MKQQINKSVREELVKYKDRILRLRVCFTKLFNGYKDQIGHYEANEWLKKTR